MYIREIALKLADGKTVTRLEMRGKEKIILKNLINIQNNCKIVIKQLKKSLINM